jgi:hypothetical protein
MKNDTQTRLFWEEVIRNGPMGLTRCDWSTIDYKLDEPGRQVLRRFLESLEDQTKWVTEQTALLRSEAERVRMMGVIMHKAGLRSYTDEKGRIYVAAEWWITETESK